MEFFKNLGAKLRPGKQKQQHLNRIRESVWNAIADGKISDQELAYIEDYYAQSGISESDFEKLKDEIFIDLVKRFVTDRRVDKNEQALLGEIVTRLGISQSVVTWAQRQVQYYRLFADLESGAVLPIGTPVGLILKKGELCHASLPARLLEERVISRNYKGGTQGISIPLGKGVRFRVGEQKGKFTSESGLKSISEGNFIITNQRLVFSGHLKSVATPISKLLDLHLFENGLNYSAEGRVKPIIIALGSGEEAELCGLIISRVINDPQ